MKNIRILFLIERAKTNVKDLVPLRCRITYLGQRKLFSTGIFMKAECWFSKLQKAKPCTDENDFINYEITLITNRLNKAFLVLQAQEEEFTVEDVYAQYSGKSKASNDGIIKYYGSFIEKLKKLIDVEIKQVTWNKYSYTYSDLKSFIEKKYNKKDIYLKNLNMAFLLDFEYYLKTEKKQKQITVNKGLQKLKRVVRIAVESNKINKFPFAGHKPKPTKTHVIYLTPEELESLEKFQFSQRRLQEVADMFIFCCYTGLAYNEMAHLERKNIIKGFDGNEWIYMQRQKTEKPISVPLLPKSKQIIEKYHKANDSILLLPVISNQKFNSYLKEIAEIVGIEKNLTHHLARKTFATTILLYNDVPIEIVSELLGHSKISITQEYYGKVVQKKVSEYMRNLARILVRNNEDSM